MERVHHAPPSAHNSARPDRNGHAPDLPPEDPLGSPGRDPDDRPETCPECGAALSLVPIHPHDGMAVVACCCACLSLYDVEIRLTGRLESVPIVRAARRAS